MALLTGAGTVVLGCDHSQDRSVATAAPEAHPPAPSGAPAGATNVQPRSNLDTSSAVERLSLARCDREQSCDNVGGGKKYASREVCMDQARGNIGNDLNSFQCPGGLDHPAVRECLAAIAGEECGLHPVESITRMEKCRSGAMCLK
jgi:hypothetical protein